MHILTIRTARELGFLAVALTALVLAALLPLAAHAQSYRGQYFYTQEGVASTSQYIYQSRSNSALQQQISALPQTATQNVTIPILFGVLPGNLTPNFGDPRDGGVRTHEGLDMMSPLDTPIVSPTAAVVIRTGTGASEGNYVYTANPGGETFVYMHLSRIGENVLSGTVLARGDLIGYVGNTGNASGGAPHLHFEIHTNGDAVDPFVRLTQLFSLQEQAASLAKIFSVASNPGELAITLVTNFRSEIATIRAQNITLPQALESAYTAANQPSIPASGIPTGDLTLGSGGAAVTNLQLFLIANSKGSAGANLAAAGATGYFGTITKSALAEYQSAVGILPNDGYYGASTRAFLGVGITPVAQLPADNSAAISQLIAQLGALQAQLALLSGNAAQTAFTRDLSLGSTGADVLALQQYLNAHGFVVATSGAGSKGNETQYFGPATRAALINFQLSKNIAPAAGYFGPLTRAVFI
jgi:murein DD-endopeptidase MepM/ murein hydrolase activator NlpD